VPEIDSNVVIACGQCGRCLSAPPLGSGYRNVKRPEAVPAAGAAAAPARPRATLGLILAGMFLAVFGCIGMARDLDVHHRMLGLVGAALLLSGGCYLLLRMWQRSRPVSAAFLIPLPDVLPHEAGAIGPPTAVFHSMSAGSALVFIGFGVLFCIAGAIGISAIVHGQAQGRMDEVAWVCSFGGLLSIIHGLRCLWSRYYLLVGPEGFLRLRGDRADVCRWDEIERFTEDVHDERKNPAWTSYTLERTDGERLVFKGNHLENIRGFGALVQEGMIRRCLPELQRRLDAGETLEFGKLRAGPEGIGSGGAILPWEEVGALQVNEAQFAVVRRGTLRSWCKVRTADVPNSFLLEALFRARNVPVGSFRSVS
jgi:hypothetical protein